MSAGTYHPTRKHHQRVMNSEKINKISIAMENNLC